MKTVIRITEDKKPISEFAVAEPRYLAIRHLKRLGKSKLTVDEFVVEVKLTLALITERIEEGSPVDVEYDIKTGWVTTHRRD